MSDRIARESAMAEIDQTRDNDGVTTTTLASRINRRQLIAYGGAAAVLPSMASIARAQEALAAATPVAGPQPMSVGYIEGSESWYPLHNVTAGFLNAGIPAPGQKAPAAAQVTPASAITAGSQELAGQSVRMRVHGIYPVANPTAAQTVYLTALFHGTDAGLATPAPFLAWGYKSVPVPDVPPPIAFTYPLGAMGTLDLQLDVAAPTKVKRRAAPGPAVGGRFTTTFTVDWFAGQPKLQRGVYLLGLTGNTWSASRSLPILKANQPRPLDLLSLIVSFEKAET